MDPQRMYTAKDLTPDELRASRISNQSFLTAFVKFSSPSGIYTATCGRDGNRIILSGCPKDVSGVEEVIAHVAGSTHKLRTTNSPPELRKIPLNGELTQARLADIVEGIRSSYPDAHIDQILYDKVPDELVENPGFPREKLRPVPYFHESEAAF